MDHLDKQFFASSDSNHSSSSAQSKIANTTVSACSLSNVPFSLALSQAKMERQEKAPVPEAHQKTSTTIVENSIDLIEPMEYILSADGRQTLRTFLQKNFDHLNTPSEVVGTYRNLMTMELVDGMPFPVKVSLRNYLVAKGLYHPHVDVHAAVYGLLDMRDSKNLR